MRTGFRFVKTLGILGIIFFSFLSYRSYAWYPVNGVAICTSTGSDLAQIVHDGNGGAIIAWRDARNGNSDIYAQRINSDGSTLWVLNGVSVCTVASNKLLVSMVSDGMNGVVIAWDDNRSGNYDIYAQRINSSGSTIWNASGVAICTKSNNQYINSVVSDGLSGAIIAWSDEGNYRSDMRTQRVELLSPRFPRLSPRAMETWNSSMQDSAMWRRKK